MKFLIKKILNEKSDLMEFGMKPGTVKKNMPKQYLFKAKNTDDDFKKSLRTTSIKVNDLYKEIDSDLKNIQPDDIILTYENGFYFIELPYEIKNKINDLSYYYSNLEYYDYLNFISPKEKISQLYTDNEEFIKEDFIYVYVDEFRNRTHFPKGLPKSLLGYGLGVKIYTKLLNTLGFIQSEPNATKEVQAVYRKMVQSKDVNVIFYRDLVLLIDINLPKEEKIKIFTESIYEKYIKNSWRRRLIPNRDFILDSKLKREIGDSRIYRIVEELFYESREYPHIPFSNL
jgi:hypothetical protein